MGANVIKRPPRGGREDDPHERDTAPPAGAPRADAEGADGPTSYRMAAPESRGAASAELRPRLGSSSLLGDPFVMRRVPRRALSEDRFRHAMLDHREGFIVSLVDGRLNVEAILDITGLPVDEALELLEGLRIAGVLSFT